MPKYDDPEGVLIKIDNEGWPDALPWLNKMRLEDDKLTDLIGEAAGVYDDLELLYREIKDRLEELGIDVYI